MHRQVIDMVIAALLYAQHVSPWPLYYAFLLFLLLCVVCLKW